MRSNVDVVAPLASVEGAIFIMHTKFVSLFMPLTLTVLYMGTSFMSRLGNK